MDVKDKEITVRPIKVKTKNRLQVLAVKLSKNPELIEDYLEIEYKALEESTGLSREEIDELTSPRKDKILGEILKEGQDFVKTSAQR